MLTPDPPITMRRGVVKRCMYDRGVLTHLGLHSYDERPDGDDSNHAGEYTERLTSRCLVK